MRPHNDPLHWWLSNPTSPLRKHDGLKGGHWSRKPSGVLAWVKDSEPTVKPRRFKRPDAPTSQRRRGDNRLIWPSIRFAGRPCCGHCNCLLAYEGEVCPGCLVWAERALVAASWRMAEERFTTMERKVA